MPIQLRLQRRMRFQITTGPGGPAGCGPRRGRGGFAFSAPRAPHEAGHLSSPSPSALAGQAQPGLLQDPGVNSASCGTRPAEPSTAAMACHLRFDLARVAAVDHREQVVGPVRWTARPPVAMADRPSIAATLRDRLTTRAASSTSQTAHAVGAPARARSGSAPRRGGGCARGEHALMRRITLSGVQFRWPGRRR